MFSSTTTRLLFKYKNWLLPIVCNPATCLRTPQMRCITVCACAPDMRTVVSAISIPGASVTTPQAGGSRSRYCHVAITESPTEIQDVMPSSLTPLQFKKIPLLVKLLSICEDDAIRLVKKCPQICNRSNEHLESSYKFLGSKNVTNEVILEMPWVLLYKPSELEVKCRRIKGLLGIDRFQTTIPFLRLSISKIYEISSVWRIENSEIKRTSPKYCNRIEFLEDKLKCSQMDVISMMSKVPALTHVPFSKLYWITELLLKHGVQSEDIQKDCWIFLHNTEMIEQRIRASIKHNLPIIKPWMLRCEDEKYEKYVERVKLKESLLRGHKDVESFLKSRLNCNDLELKSILEKSKALKRASAKKLNVMLQFLYSNNFSTRDIIETPRILANRVGTVQKRLEELKKYNYPVTLKILSKPTVQYEALMQMMKAHKE